MKVSNLLENFTMLLLEANVYNIKEKFNKVSIESFVREYANMLSTKEVQDMFTKKISRLLMNDNRYLFAVRELPQNAPEWAKVAFDKDELMYFNPSDQLKDDIGNIMHYVSCIEEDAQSTNNNIAVPAKRELQGFPKAENLNILLQAQRNYFSKGARRAERSTEGMEEALSLPSGYTWYRLVSAKAFQQEGQTLGICVGRIYTAETCARTGMRIYVLRDPQGNSVVCMSTMNEDKTAQEIKGKQNLPPVRKYMPAVQAFMNHLAFTSLSGTAEADLQSAGYFYKNGRILTREQAAEEWLTNTQVGTLPSGYKVIQISSESTQLLNDVFALARHGVYLYNSYSGSRQMKASVYDVRNTNNESMFFGVTDDNTKALKSVSGKQATNSKELKEEEQNVADFMNFLFSKKYIAALSGELAQQLVWQEGLVWDPATNKLEKNVPDNTFDINNTLVKEYLGSKAVQLAKGTQQNMHSEQVFDDVKKVFVVRIGSDTLIAILDDKTMSFIARHDRWFRRPDFSNPVQRALAYQLGKREHATLHPMVQVELGLVSPIKDKTPNAYLEAVDPTFETIQSAFNAKKCDLTQYKTTNDKLVAALVALEKISTTVNVPTLDMDQVPHFNLLHYRHRVDATTSRELEETWIKEAFEGQVPTALYFGHVTYGVEKTEPFLMLVSNQRVLAITQNILNHHWQSHDDYEHVRDELNNFLDEQHLKLAPSVAKNTYGCQFVVKGEKFETKRTIAHNRLEKARGKETVENKLKEVKFADGTTIVPMGTQEFAKWSRLEAKQSTLVGTPWKIIKNNVTEAIFVVNTKGTITAFCHRDGDAPGEPTFAGVIDKTKFPTRKYINLKLVPYIKAIAEQMGWNFSNQFKVRLSDREIRLLNKLKDYTEPVTRYKLFRDLNYNSTHFSSSWYGDYDLQSLEEDGFVRSNYHNYDRTTQLDWNDREGIKAREKIVTIQITPLGRRVLEALDGNHYDSVALSSTAELEGFEKPTVTAPAPAQPREDRPRAAPVEGGESKAGQALARFRQMAQANNGTMPGRSEFMRILQAEPFNMSAAGAQTYYYNTKAKYLQQQGQINERMTFSQFLKVLGD